MKPKVFVAQDAPQLNLSPAKKFGELVVVLPVGNMTHDIDRTIRKIKTKLDPMGPQDYLLPIGDPLMIGLVMAVALRYASGGPLKVLRWDRQESMYDVVELNGDF